jgi:cell division protein FtsB
MKVISSQTPVRRTTGADEPAIRLNAGRNEPMLQRQQRRPRTPWIRRAVLFFACVILLDSLIGDRGLGRTLRAREDHHRAAADLARLKALNAALRGEIHHLQTDPATIEAVAREELGLIRAGEILVVLGDVK